MYLPIMKIAATITTGFSLILGITNVHMSHGVAASKTRLLQDPKTDLIQDLKTMMNEKRTRTLPGGKKRTKRGKRAFEKDTFCTLCWNGASYSNPDTVVPLAGRTCAEVDDILRVNVTADDPVCSYAQVEFGVDCGCPVCPGVCPNGEPVGNPDRLVPREINGDVTYDDTCAELDALLPLAPNGNEACIGVSYVSEYCGCRSYKPVCTACANNDVMPNYSKIAPLTINNGTEIFFLTCGQLAYDITMEVDLNLNSPDCPYDQVTSAIFCDCPSIPKSYQSGCSLCKPDEILSTSLEPVVFDIYSCRGLDAYAQAAPKYFNDVPCEHAERLNELLEIVTTNGRATCCTAKNPKQAKAKKSEKAASKGDVRPALDALKKKLKMTMMIMKKTKK